MATVTVDPNIVSVVPGAAPALRDKARKLAREALATNSTAESAARSINENPLNKNFRANHQDNFDEDQTRPEDYADKALDNRWLVVIADPKAK